MAAWAIVLVGVVVVAGIVAALVLTPRLLKWARSRDLDKRLPGAGGGPDVELALARAAYERDDYRRVCEWLSSNWPTRSLSAQLLFADACKELGTVKGDEASVAVFEKLADNLRNDKGTSVEKVESLSSQEKAILGSVLDERPELAAQKPELAALIGVPSPTKPAAVYPPGQAMPWAKLRRQVIEQKKKAERRKFWWRVAEVALGLVSAAAAAVAGVTVLKSAGSSTPGGKITVIQWFVIVLALLSAVVSTLLVMLKPAEKADAADKEAIALDDLLAAMDVFAGENKEEANANKRDKDLRAAVAAVHERLRGARNRPPPRALIKR